MDGPFNWHNVDSASLSLSEGEEEEAAVTPLMVASSSSAGTKLGTGKKTASRARKHEVWWGLSTLQQRSVDKPHQTSTRARTS